MWNYDATTLLYTLTTLGGGYLCFNGPSADYEFEFPTTGYGNIGKIITSGIVETVSPIPASGYYCIGGCQLPTDATSLSATWTVAGAQTFSYSGGNWVSSFTASGNSYIVNIVSAGVAILRNGVNCGVVGYSIASCPPSYSATITPPTGSCLTELGTATVT
jgi:hypothetical protein